MQTIKTTLENAVIKLENAKIDNANREAYILFSHAINKDITYIISHENYMTEEHHAALYDAYITKRCGKMPVAYITGTKEFMSLNFFVNENVLIPRPETEILAEEAITLLSGRDKPELLDLCCGSGCVGVSAAEYIPQCNVTFSDISMEAIEVAKKNSAEHQARKRASFIVSDMFDALPAKQFDMIVSNPPYITEEEYASLSEEILLYEPRQALDGGTDGLIFYNTIAQKAAQYMKENAYLLLEIGCNQAKDVTKLLKQHKFTDISVKPDLAGKDRIIVAKNGVKQ